MSVVCKIIAYTNDESFAERIEKILNDERYELKVVNLFADVIGALQKELFDVLIMEIGFVKESGGLLKLVDDISLGMPIIVACMDEVDLKVEDGVNSKFYFLNKFADEDKWKRALQMAIDENYLITNMVNLK